jgi:hypothetical protein
MEENKKKIARRGKKTKTRRRDTKLVKMEEETNTIPISGNHHYWNRESEDFISIVYHVALSVRAHMAH